MLMEIIFHPSPGALYDLYNLLIMKLNIRGKWLYRVANSGHETADMEYIEDYLAQFEDPSPELSIFFYKKNRIASTYIDDLYLQLLETYQGDLSLSHLLDYIQIPDQVQHDICRFYLGDTVDFRDLPAVSKAVENVSLKSEDVRFHLLCFFARPQHYIEVLVQTLQSYDTLLQDIYQRRAEELNNLPTDMLLQQVHIALYDELDPDLMELGGKDVHVTYAIICKNTMLHWQNWYILGLDYDASIEAEFTVQFDVEKFGDAIGDQTRYEILQLILKAGEISSADIAKHFGYAINTINYHLRIMTDAQLLCCRTLDRATYYWLNIRLCEKGCKVLDHWIERSAQLNAEALTKARRHPGRKRGRPAKTN